MASRYGIPRRPYAGRAPALRHSLVPACALFCLLSTSGACGSGAGGDELPRPLEDGHLDPEVVGQIDAAIEQVLGTSEGSQKRTGALYELALTYDGNTLFELAAETYALVVEAAPQHARAWYDLGRMRSELGRPEESLEAFDRALEEDAELAEAHWRRGLSLLDLDRLEEARDAFEQATQADASDPSGWLGLARVALQRNEHQNAIDALQHALRLQPLDGYAHLLLGRALNAAGETERARRELSQEDNPTVAWFDPNEGEVAARAAGYGARVRQADGLLNRGDPGAALLLLRELAQKRPEDVTVQAMLSTALIRLNDLDEALARLDEARRLHPDHYRLEMNRGVVLHLRGESGLALSHLRRSVELHPEFGSGHAYLGRVRFEVESYERAVESLAEAHRLGYRPLHALALYARALGTIGRFTRALEVCEEGLTRWPENGELWNLKAAAQAELGDLASARASLARAEAAGLPGARTTVVRARINELEGQAPDAPDDQ